MAIGMKPSNNETKDSTNKDSTNKVESLVDKNVTQKSNKNTIIIIAVVAVIVIIIIAMLKSLMTPEEPIEMTDTGQVDGTTQEAATTTAQGATTEFQPKLLLVCRSLMTEKMAAQVLLFIQQMIILKT